MNMVQKLRQLTDQIKSSQNGLEVADAWTLASRLLGRVGVEAGEIKRMVAERDVATLDRVVTGLEHPSGPPSGDTGRPASFGEQELASALRAFRKRIKLGRLADESRLGGRYTSGGRVSKIDAIEPPKEFPPEIWKALERAGKLEHTGGGFYREPGANPPPGADPKLKKL